MNWIRYSCLGMIALQSAACAATPQDNGPSAKEQVTTTEAALYETSTSCKTGAAMRTISLSSGSRGDKFASEGTITSRASTCNAWVVDWKWTTAPSGSDAYLMSGTSNSMPGDQQNCEGVWKSDEYYGYNATTHFLHSGDFYAYWDGLNCLWPGNLNMPSEGGEQNMLHFSKTSSHSSDRLATYSRVRIITQPHWIYWPIPGWANLYLP